MPNKQMKTLTINGETFDIVDQTARQGAVPAPSQIYSTKYLGYGFSGPQWYDLRDQVPGLVVQTIIVGVTEQYNDFYETWSWQGDSPENALAIAATPRESQNSIIYFLTSKEVNDGYVTFTFKRIDGDDYFTYAETTSEWTYHDGLTAEPGNLTPLGGG